MIFDHIDFRVRNVASVKTFYDPFMRALGFRGRPQPDGTVLYLRIAERKINEVFVLIEEAAHRPNSTRLAFSAATRNDVDRIAEVASRSGARAYEAPALCPEIAENYYAAFFEDPDGNRLEIVCR